MRICIPTTKQNNAALNIRYSNVFVWSGLTEEGLLKLGITEEYLLANGYGFKYNDPGTVYYGINLEVVSEAHHYAGAKLAYLKEHGVKGHDHWVLPCDKAQDFINGNIPALPKSNVETVTISICQTNIAKVGGTYIDKYVAFNNLDYGCIDIVPRKDYKYYHNTGECVYVNVCRPEVMWGTEQEIKKEIIGIISNKLLELGYITNDNLTTKQS